ncbi:MAG TPA: hypothetical protein QGF95_18755 [Candidatus Latescibacteria bacterium]|jgi:chromosome segregation ATPase|nr:hypothetical protein [Gemmatimonadaceae bacterium]MDP6015428.1 hypothetical protein [Candidatus Latescibacterota bacterium]HJP32589.1 hypothetical protein [Candidatus Latescibacterota bacterium]|tara:strand:+ start:113 stop:445 length:333 start_codon:yes stop_codon:yes gene_type:complete
MGFIPFIAIGLVLVTVAASLVTGQRLGEVRKSAFQLEMQAEQLRRQVTDLEEHSQQAAGRVRALINLRSKKRESLAEMYDELKELKSGGKAISVAAGLQQRSFELAEAAA